MPTIEPPAPPGTAPAPAPPATLALSVGCPCGIGPEVTLGALRELYRDAPTEGAAEPPRVLVFGDLGALEAAAKVLGCELAALETRGARFVGTAPLEARERAFGQPNAAAGRAQLEAIDAALDEVLAGRAAALVTGPASKAAITASGARFVGHTEHLQARCGAPRVVMSFVGPRLRTALVTTHVPVASLSTALTREAVRETAALFARALVDDFGLVAPRVAVCGLNPHAGEGGLFGREELDALGPAVADARALLGATAELVGPLAAEAAFRQARDGHFDAVLAMYHDQATIASKLLDFGAAVNVTLGLPIVRTSVDHGTGYDIAGTGRADASGMSAALALAATLGARRAARAAKPAAAPGAEFVAAAR